MSVAVAVNGQDFTDEEEGAVSELLQSQQSTREQTQLKIGDSMNNQVTGSGADNNHLTSDFHCSSDVPQIEIKRSTSPSTSL